MNDPSPSTDESTSEVYELSDNEPHTEAIVIAVARTIDRCPTEMPPLGDVLDPDAVNASLDPTVGRSSIQLSFEYCGCAVRATQNQIEVEPVY